MDTRDVYINVNKYVNLALKLMAQKSFWWQNGICSELIKQADILMAEIESCPFNSEPDKVALYLETTNRKLETIYNYHSPLVTKILTFDQVKIITVNGERSPESKQIIINQVKKVASQGTALNLLITKLVGDQSKRTELRAMEAQTDTEADISMKVGWIDVRTVGLLLAVDRLMQRFNPKSENELKEPVYIWKHGINYLLELFHMLKWLGWIITNPATKRPVTIKDEAEAICALFKPIKSKSENPAEILATYMRESNHDKPTKADKPLANLPKKRKFDQIKSHDSVENSL